MGEDLADDADDLFGVVIVFGEDQGLGHPLTGAAAEEIDAELVAETLEDGPDLVGDGDGAVEVVGAVGEIGVELLIAQLAGATVPDGDLVRRVDGTAMLADQGADAKDLEADVDVIDDGLLIGVLGDEIASPVASK